jgi:menaquinone-dependent protoporphyrinogen oxidase
MSDQVLVAYAPREESTRGIAASVAEVLEDAGVRVRLQTVDAVGDPRASRAAIIGCSVFGGEWLAGARSFLKTHVAALEAMPVWLFASAPVVPLPEDPGRRDVPRDLVALVERIRPRDVALFAGSLQPHHVGSGLRVLAKLSRSSFTGRRDWTAVERWAQGIAAELRTGAAAEGS